MTPRTLTRIDIPIGGTAVVPAGKPNLLGHPGPSWKRGARTALFILLTSAGMVLPALAGENDNLLSNADFHDKFSGWVAEDYRDSSLAELISGGRLFQIEEDGETLCVVLEAEGDFAALTATPSVPCEEGVEYVLRYEVRTNLSGSRFIADLCTANEEKAYLRSSSTASPEYQILDAGNWQKQEVSIVGQSGDAYVFPHFIIRSGSRIFLRNIHLEKTQ